MNLSQNDYQMISTITTNKLQLKRYKQTQKSLFTQPLIFQFCIEFEYWCDLVAQLRQGIVKPYGESLLVLSVWCRLCGSSTLRSVLLAWPIWPHTNCVGLIAKSLYAIWSDYHPHLNQGYIVVSHYSFESEETQKLILLGL